MNKYNFLYSFPHFHSIPRSTARGLRRYYDIVLKKTDSPPYTVFRGSMTNFKVKQLHHFLAPFYLLFPMG